MHSATASRVLVFASSFLALLCASAAEDSTKAKTQGVQISEVPDRLHIEINGKLFTEYFFRDVPRPYYYPLIGPGGLAMTRNWPMKSPPGEEHDHPHHRSLWFGHGDINGIDFWAEKAGCGKTVHRGFDKIESGEKMGIISSRNDWVGPDGKTICTDNRTFRVFSDGGVFDFEITIHASNGDVTFGDTKEGTMAVRLAESMKLKGHEGTAHIVESSGAHDAATWGKKADWCDYYGPVEGKTVGIAIFDHPKNPRHPTWWHVRDYGLFAANPFGQNDFENLKDKTAGNLKLPAGQNITFRYRFYLHEADEKQAQVAQKYQEYIKGK